MSGIEVRPMVDVRLAAHKQARRDQQRQRERHLRDDERAPQPTPPRMLRSAFVLQSAGQVVACRLKRGRQTEEKSRTQRERERINYGAWTQAQIVTSAVECRQQILGPAREEQPQGAARERQQQTLGQELPDQTPAPGAD